MTPVSPTFDGLRAQRERLIAMLQATSDRLARINLSPTDVDLSTLIDRLSTSTFKILVLGELKRGKSTLINALLGAEILPAYAYPCTALITEIKWGPQPRALLHFRQPLTAPLPSTLPTNVTEHLRRALPGPVPPLDVSVKSLEDYAVISDPSDSGGAAAAESPYDRLEIFWPLPLCRHGVEIIDSPGLNEHYARTKVTGEYLPKADAVLFTLTCTQFGSESEMHTLDDVRRRGHDHIFVACNQVDQIRPDQRQKFIEFVHRKLDGKTALKDGIFILSAWQALQAKQAGDAAQLVESGLSRLEHVLEDYLVRYRGRAKMIPPAKNLHDLLGDVLRTRLPEQRAMLHTGLEPLRQRAAQVKPQLLQAEQRLKKIVDRVERHRATLRDAIRSEVYRYQNELARDIPTWTSGLSVANTVNSFKFWDIKGQVTKLCEEVVLAVTKRVEASQAAWERDSLHPLIRRWLDTMSEDVEAPLQEFFDELKGIRATMAGLKAPIDPETDGVTGLERVLAGAGGFFIGGAGALLDGVTQGYKGMLYGLVPQLGVGIGTVLLFGWNPVLLLAALLGTSIVRSVMYGESLTEKSKAHVGKAISEQVLHDAHQVAEKAADDVFHHTAPILQTVRQALERELQAVRDEFSAALQLKEAGEREVQQRLALLDDVQADFQQLSSDLNRLALDLAQPTA